jgi:hypothetical protein
MHAEEHTLCCKVSAALAKLRIHASMEQLTGSLHVLPAEAAACKSSLAAEA